MTNAQKWIAVFLGLFLILFLLERITKEEEPVTHLAMEQMSQQSGTDGLVLIKQSNCFSCHGSDLNGTSLGPALANIKQFWTRDALINYLHNPLSYKGDARFNNYRAKYKNSVMPSYEKINVEGLGKIADYLLSIE